MLYFLSNSSFSSYSLNMNTDDKLSQITFCNFIRNVYLIKLIDFWTLRAAENLEFKEIFIANVPCFLICGTFSFYNINHLLDSFLVK